MSMAEIPCRSSRAMAKQTFAYELTTNYGANVTSDTRHRNTTAGGSIGHREMKSLLRQEMWRQATLDLGITPCNLRPI